MCGGTGSSQSRLRTSVSGSPKGNFPVDHFVEDYTEGKEVAARVLARPLNLHG